MKQKLKSKMMAAIHETVSDLTKAGLVTAEATQRFNLLCRKDKDQPNSDDGHRTPDHSQESI